MADTTKIGMSGGDVLVYKPTTVIPKDINTIYKESTTCSEYDQVTPLVQYTTAVLHMAENMPSSVNSSLDNGVLNMDRYLDMLNSEITDVSVNGISFEDYKLALTNGDKDIVDSFIDYHYNNINGSNNVEIYNRLHNLKEESLKFKSNFNSITYGKADITYDDIIKVDDAKLNQLLDLESSGNSNKINYAALNSDVRTNVISSAYAGLLNSQANNLYMLTVSVPIDNITDTNGTIKRTLTNAFDKSSSLNKQDLDKESLSTDTDFINNSLNNVTNSRSKVLDVVHAINELKKNNGNETYIDTIKDALTNSNKELMNNTVDYNKAIYLTAINKEDDLSSLKEKCDIRNIFNSIK